MSVMSVGRPPPWKQGDRLRLSYQSETAEGGSVVGQVVHFVTIEDGWIEATGMNGVTTRIHVDDVVAWEYA